MEKKNMVYTRNSQNVYDDGNIPAVDLPQDSVRRRTSAVPLPKSPDYEHVEPLPESSRPRKDGPGGA